MQDQGESQASGTYMLPRHPSEVDRLDVQHYALREALGANYLAPVEGPALVLDVCSGTGEWAFELCSRFPASLVIGLDLEPSKPERPANYRFVRADALAGLPFADDRFDFVHQRFMTPALPLKYWPALVGEMVRVTRPGGLIELVEPALRIEPAGPASERVFELVQRVGVSLGLDMEGAVFRSLDERLRDASLVEVSRRDVVLPVGEWGGIVGSLMATDVRAAAARLSVVFQERFGVSAVPELMKTMQQEWEEYHSTYAVAFAWGRKNP